MASNSREDLYSQITSRIIADLEAGTVPWVQPWAAAAAPLGLPRNAATGRAYSGVNILLLWAAVMDHDFPSQRWLTFRQAAALGGNVRKGEHGTMVVFADRFVPEREKARARETGDEPVRIPFLKRFTVFNLAQCEGLPADLQEEIEGSPTAPRLDLILPRAQSLISATGARLRIGGNHAFYAPGDDLVVVPPPEAFFDSVNWHRTALHELGHWTGHATRLRRDQKGAFGSASYAREELVAEMAGAFVCAALGIEPTVRHADYLAVWLAVLRQDSRAIVRAASAASRAAQFLLAFDGGEVGEVQRQREAGVSATG
jgi:antirestriction protein ArdC